MRINFHHFSSLHSTNTYAKEHFSFHENDLTVIWADEQREGRGRLERSWSSPLGGLYASFCFLPKKEDEPLFFIYLMIISLAQLLEKEQVKCKMKMPNDLLVNNQKIAGLLIEKVGDGVILGVGLNVNQGLAELEKIDQPATSIHLQTHKRYEITPLVHELASLFAKNLQKFQAKGFGAFSSEMESLK